MESFELFFWEKVKKEEIEGGKNVWKKENWEERRERNEIIVGKFGRVK